MTRRALSSMGADFRDIDNDGRDDLFVTALHNETFPFYRNTGKIRTVMASGEIDAIYASIVKILR